MGRYKTKLQAIQEANKRILGEQTVSFDGQGNYSYYDAQGNPTDAQGNPLSSITVGVGDKSRLRRWDDGRIDLTLDKATVTVGAALLGALVGKTIKTIKNKRVLKDVLTTIDNTIDKKTKRCLTKRLNWVSGDLANLNDKNKTDKTDEALEYCLKEVSGKDIEEFKTEFHNSIKNYNLKG